MFSTEKEIMQAYKEGKEFGIIHEHRRVRMVAIAVPEKDSSSFPDMQPNHAAWAAVGWNDCRAELLKAIGVTA